MLPAGSASTASGFAGQQRRDDVGGAPRRPPPASATTTTFTPRPRVCSCPAPGYRTLEIMATPSASEAAVRAARALLAAESVGVLSTISVHRAGLPVRLGHAVRAVRAGGAAAAAVAPGRAHQEPARRSARQPVRRRSHGGRGSAGGRARLAARPRVAAARRRRAPTPAPATSTAWPRGADYLALGDFSLWRLDIEEARLIAGFGEIRWLDGAALRRLPQPKTRVSRRRASAEDDRPVARHQHAAFQVQPNRAGQHAALQLAALAHQLRRRRRGG